jgi:hypothetical protein
MEAFMLAFPDVAVTFASLLRALQPADRVGVALLLAKLVLRDLPPEIRKETADEFATHVRRLYDG